MAKVADFTKETPFHKFCCLSCGKTMGDHWIYRAESFADIRGAGRKPDGKYYCQSDGMTASAGHFQRELANTLHPGYEGGLK